MKECCPNAVRRGWHRRLAPICTEPHAPDIGIDAVRRQVTRDVVRGAKFLTQTFAIYFSSRNGSVNGERERRRLIRRLDLFVVAKEIQHGKETREQVPTRKASWLGIWLTHHG